VTADAISQVGLLAVAFALTLMGAAAAFAGANVWKRIGGVLASLMGAVLGCGALGAGAGAIVAVMAVVLGYCMLGAAVGVRIQEAYGAVETPALDSADQGSEPPEPRA
jgi:hypothetical protein